MPRKKPAAQLDREIATFLTRSGGKGPVRRAHASKLKDDDGDDSLKEPWLKKIHAQSGKSLAMLIAALKKSPAFIITDRYGRKDLIVRSGEMQNRHEGKLRVTMFGTDGPRGHITKNTDKELTEELKQSYAIKSIKPASDADVMRWTGSCEFADGSRRVALVQALNTLGFRASKTQQHDRAREIASRAYAVMETDIDKAIAIVEAGIKEIS